MRKIAADNNYRMLKSAQSMQTVPVGEDHDRYESINHQRKRMHTAFDDLEESFDIMVRHGGDPLFEIEWTGTTELRMALRNNPFQ